MSNQSYSTIIIRVLGIGTRYGTSDDIFPTKNLLFFRIIRLKSWHRKEL